MTMFLCNDVRCLDCGWFDTQLGPVFGELCYSPGKWSYSHSDSTDKQGISGLHHKADTEWTSRIHCELGWALNVEPWGSFVALSK